MRATVPGAHGGDSSYGGQYEASCRKEIYMSKEARFWVVTDLETLGLNPEKHDIIQIARVVMDVASRSIVPHSEMVTYVKPSRWNSADREALDTHNISYETAMAGKLLPEALGLWCREIDWSQSVLAAWGIDFETRFLTKAFKATNRIIPFDYRTIDIRTLCHGFRAAFGATDYLSLADMCKEQDIMFEKDRGHDALYDAQKTAEAARAILDETWRLELNYV
ncbi:hypothetical protein LCGC14_0264760 [marine sediment metagenome]|uniref:Exonuclease domain-containing protein n=1 Tax=marine sediment metagenome TaxID=412755 RepID=A0A0F9X5S4_9ZZZZ